MCDEITSPFPSFNAATIEVWGKDVLFHPTLYWPCGYLSMLEIMLVKRLLAFCKVKKSPVRMLFHPAVEQFSLMIFHVVFINNQSDWKHYMMTSWHWYPRRVTGTLWGESIGDRLSQMAFLKYILFNEKTFLFLLISNFHVKKMGYSSILYRAETSGINLVASRFLG